MWRLLALLLLMQPLSYPTITAENAGQLTEIYNFVVPRATDIAFHPLDSHQLAVAQGDGVISVWEPNGPYVRVSWNAEAGEVKSLAFSPDGAYLISAHTGGVVQVREATSGNYTLRRELTLPNALPLEVDAALDGIVAVSYVDGKVRLWDAETGDELAMFYGYTYAVTAIDLVDNFNGTFFAFGFGATWDGFVNIYRLDNARNGDIFLAEVLTDMGEMNDFQFHPISPPDQFLALGMATAANHLDGVRLWDPFSPSGPVDHLLPANFSYPAHVEFNSDGVLLAVAGTETTAGGSCSVEVVANNCPIKILYARFDREREQEVLVRLVEHNDSITDVEFSADDQFLASASQDGLVVIWAVLP